MSSRYAAAQVKKAMDATLALGGENYVFWGGREGYETLLNTNLKREQDHLAAFLHMAVDYAKSIGFKGQFLIEPKPKEPTKHQYDFDVASGIAFLRTYGLEKYFKFNIETNHATLGRPHLRARDRGRRLAGHARLDRRQHRRPAPGLGHRPVQHQRQGAHPRDGLHPARRGPRFRRLQLRRQAAPSASIDPEDLFHAHIGGMDAYARGFKLARRILAEGKFEQFVAHRYSSFDSGYGKDIEKGKADFKSLEKLVLSKLGEPTPKSGKQEYLENLLNTYLHG